MQRRSEVRQACKRNEDAWIQIGVGANLEKAFAAAGACAGVGVIDGQLAELAHMHEQLARAGDHRAHHPAPAPQLPPVQVPV